MANASIPGLAAIRQVSPEIGRALEYLQTVQNNVAQQVNAAPVGIIPSPTPHAALDVQGGNGYFRVDITDSSAGYRGKEHFVEVSEDLSFQNPHLIHLGASTSWYGPLGEKNLHFRTYSQYPTSAPSAPTYHNNVSGVGGTTPSISSNQVGGQGYGLLPYMTVTPPTRG
jgi:hypothetical protein